MTDLMGLAFGIVLLAILCGLFYFVLLLITAPSFLFETIGEIIEFWRGLFHVIRMRWRYKTCSHEKTNLEFTFCRPYRHLGDGKMVNLYSRVCSHCDHVLRTEVHPVQDVVHIGETKDKILMEIKDRIIL